MRGCAYLRCRCCLGAKQDEAIVLAKGVTGLRQALAGDGWSCLYRRGGQGDERALFRMVLILAMPAGCPA